MPCAKCVELSAEQAGRIRPLNKHTDWDSCVALSDVCHARSFWYESPDSGWSRLQLRRQHDREIDRYGCTDRNGNLTAYVMVAAHNHIFDAAWRPDAGADLVLLLKHVLAQAAQSDRGPQHVRASLPRSAELMSTLTEHGLSYDLVETRGSIGANMVKIVNFQRLLQRFEPELTHRLQRCQAGPCRLCFELTDAGPPVWFSSAGPEFVHRGPGPYDLKCTFDQAQALSLFMGHSTPASAAVSIEPATCNGARLATQLFQLEHVVGP